jgi:S1-C subfamily serine protease
MESGLVDAVADVVPAQFNDGVGHTGFGITTATAITNGDSGGPVIDSNGKLVGIVTAGDPNNMKKVHCCTAANVLDALSTALTDRYNQELPRGKPKADGWRLGLRLCSQ